MFDGQVYKGSRKNISIFLQGAVIYNMDSR